MPMKLDRLIRTGIAIAVLLLLVIALAAILFLTESALNVWDRLADASPLFVYSYAAVLALLVFLALWLIWRLIVKRDIRPNGKQQRAPLTREEIEARLRDADSLGVAADDARAELTELRSRQASGDIHLCFFGEISTGKSSLIRALAPGASVAVDVRGGSTVAISHYRWTTANGATLLLTDVPGTGGHEAGLDELALDEARRAHIVLFVCDSDLNRAEFVALEQLVQLDKPVILILNKADRYSLEERAVLVERLLERLEEAGGVPDRDRVVTASAGGEIEVIERSDDGV